MITAKIITHSIDPRNDSTIVTFELEYPRFIHAELMTHRLFSRNAASSRAIPIDKMIQMVLDDPAMPHVWGLNQSGMQAETEHTNTATCVWAWEQAAKAAVKSAKLLQDLGLHKQIVNRVLEPFQTMKTVVTATEYDNWFFLRNHEHAQPEIHILAEVMLDELRTSDPQPLEPGQWHLPYVDIVFSHGEQASEDTYHYEADGVEVSLQDALKVSASCCAQVSYRVLDQGLEKALRIYESLLGSKPMHASPVEHQASPMWELSPEHGDQLCDLFDNGITHLGSDLEYWSGNFKGWTQYRQMIKGHTCYDYEAEASLA